MRPYAPLTTCWLTFLIYDKRTFKLKVLKITVVPGLAVTSSISTLAILVKIKPNRTML